jgi:DNA invertase Pin-like site-specific DNA recombinase
VQRTNAPDSPAAGVRRNRESTARQYALADRACQLGWSKQRVIVVDEDLGLSGSSSDKRSGFARLTSEVALTHVGIVLDLEVSRLARKNADWYRLLELCGITDTLIGDNDGVYHPALFNDRLLGLKGTMGEAELHIIRARLDGGIRNKAARGELRRGLPVGFIWGEADGEVLFHPDEAVTGAIRTVFERFAEFGSARRVWLRFRSEGLSLPLQEAPSGQLAPIRWVAATYTAIHHILTNPVYAGAYTYGKTKCERYVGDHGIVRKRIRHLPLAQWAVLIPQHHTGFIDWATFQANQNRLDSNTRPQPHQAGGAVREGSALLQGIATCGHCGRRLHTHYRGRNSTPGYHCAGKDLANGRGVYCLNVGGLAIEQAVADDFIKAVTPAAVETTLLTVEQLQANHDAALSQWRLEVERARYETERAERRHRNVEPRKQAGRTWAGKRMGESSARTGSRRNELRRREQHRPNTFTAEQLKLIQRLGSDIRQVWQAPTTTDRDHQELLRTLLEEVVFNLKRAEGHAHLTLRWRGGAITILDIGCSRSAFPSRGATHR